MNEETKRHAGFVEKWAGAEQMSAFLGITLYALIVFCVVLVIVLFKVVTRPQAIYYIPGAPLSGIAYPNRIEKGAVLGFASCWLLDRNNFTPVTVKDTYIRAMRYMAPELLSRTKAGLEEEVTRVERDNISSLFSLKSDPQLLEEAKDYKATLTGEKSLFMGKEKLDTRTLRYTITLERRPPTETNPFGLMVAGVKQEELKEDN